MILLTRANDALAVNPPIGTTEFLSVGGSDWLWAVTAVYILTFVSLPSLHSAHKIEATHPLIHTTLYTTAWSLGLVLHDPRE